MCTNCKYIYNKYLNKGVYVPCGKCESCLQQKANARVTRIRNSYNSAYLPLFVTLTYDKYSCPYILRDDLTTGHLQLNVYRDCTCRYNRSSADYDSKLVRTLGTTIIDDLVLDDHFYDTQSLHDIMCCPAPRGLSQGAIGISYYPDLQNFYKRLKQNLKRHYHVDETNFYYFSTAEYGETTYRPHFHALIFVPYADEASFRSAILESWPFSDKKRLKDYIEVARDCASYVAAYVNSASDFPSLLKNRSFRPKHSASKGFGVHLACFSLLQILEKTDNGALEYYVSKGQREKGIVSALTIPKYVINRWFPRFKGYTRFDSDSLAVILRHPKSLCRYGWPDDQRPNEKEIREIEVMLNNAYKRYFNVTHKSYEHYIIDYLRVWRCYSSTQLRHFYEDGEKTSFVESYDNINEYLSGYVHSYNLDDYFDGHQKPVEVNPNLFVSRINVSNSLKLQYHRKLKTKKVLNICMAQMDHFV